MTIDQVRDAVRTDSVRRLVDSAPSAEELRTTISEGIAALGEGIDTVAERVDHSAELLRERVNMPEPVSGSLDRLAALPVELGLRKPPRRTVPPAVAIVVGLAIGLVAAALVIRLGRRPLDAVRERMTPLLGRVSGRAGIELGESGGEREGASPARRRDDVAPERGARAAVAVPIETGIDDASAEERARAGSALNGDGSPMATSEAPSAR